MKRVRDELRKQLDRAYCENFIDFTYGSSDPGEMDGEVRRDAVLRAWREEEEEERQIVPDLVVVE